MPYHLPHAQRSDKLLHLTHSGMKCFPGDLADVCLDPGCQQPSTTIHMNCACNKLKIIRNELARNLQPPGFITCEQTYLLLETESSEASKELLMNV